MPQTLAEKLLSNKAGSNLKAGDIAVFDVDLSYAHDGSAPIVLIQLEKMKNVQIFDPSKVMFFIDHVSPSSRRELSNDHINMRKFAAQHELKVYDVGQGICHQIALEKYIKPGDLMVCADSHTCTGGALSAFAAGMGATDVGVIFTSGKTWLRVPETIRVEVDGELPAGVYSKDVILYLIGLLGSDGATYKALEFDGSTVRAMEMDERITLANMAVEAGAKAGLLPSDQVTFAYLKDHNRKSDWLALEPDEGAVYSDVIKIDARKLDPVVAVPHNIDNVRKVTEVSGIRVNQISIGSCTNGRLNDLCIAANILRGKKIYQDTRLIIVPASKKVLLDAMNAGYIQDLVEAGAAIGAVGCGSCTGSNNGVLGDQDVCLTTQNRNFKGRMGNPDAELYLASPATAAASAITGKITDPRRFYDVKKR